MEVESFVALSTGHLTAETLQSLSECKTPDDLPFPGGITNFGYWTYVFTNRPEGRHAIPDDLWICMNLVGGIGVKYILFDADASPSSELPYYEH